MNVGVTLQIAPRVSDDGFVTSHVFCVVSSVTGTSQGYPTISQREAATSATVRDGETFVIGGLTEDSNIVSDNRVPVLGDLPGLGRLFSERTGTRSKTELYIVVTPHVVKPLSPADPIHTPLDSTLPGNDVDFFLMGQAEVSPSLARLAVGALNRPYVGHVLDLPKNGGVYVTARD